MSMWGPEVIIVSPDLAGWRLDRLLVALRPEVSRTRWQAAIRQGTVRINDRIVTTPGRTVTTGERVQAAAPPDEMPAHLTYEASPLPIRVAYEDRHLLVVAKPRGLVVHPSAGHWHHTLVQALLPSIEDAGGEPYRPGIVHRLDKDTSGLLIVARTPEARQRLSDMLQARTIHRSYWALAEGHLEPAAGRIEAPIARHPGNRLKMAVVLNGQPAATAYRTLAVWPRCTWLELDLETGRTHQIRVHLAHMGHPVVGDPLYGTPDALGFPGQALHAWQLQFRHPFTGEVLTLTEPCPDDWRPGLALLGPPAEGSVPADALRTEPA